MATPTMHESPVELRPDPNHEIWLYLHPLRIYGDGKEETENEANPGAHVAAITHLEQPLGGIFLTYWG